MFKLSDTVERKFIESIDLDEWEIETDTGWVDISSIHKTIEYDAWEIKTEDGFYLKGADNHIIFDEYYNEVFIKDTQAGMYILTKNGLSIVSEVNNLHCKENMFDITVNHENHRYYTSGILSHNTEAVRGFILHYIIFNEEKTIGLLANKGDTAKEILGKIQLAYQHLPKWLQQGVKEFNKNSFVLENGCRVIAAATSSDAIRGYTLHCVSLDTKVTVRYKDTMNIVTVPIYQIIFEQMGVDVGFIE